jgi:ssDNA-binding Zn-finger/Zn-ribbon topoisomerase 1
MTNAIHPPICPDCALPMQLRDSRFGKFWGCPNYPRCQSKVGAHQESGAPLGRPGTPAERKARIEAHAAFDKLWHCGFYRSRGEAYRWMRKAMDMSEEEAHIGNFGVAECTKLVKLVRDRFAQGRFK